MANLPNALWIIGGLAALSALFVFFCWYGSDIVFHPPRMLPMEVFPEQFGLEYEKTSFTAEDGVELKGWFLPAARKTDKSLILCHGWGDNKGDLLSRMRFLAGRFNLFFFDSRAHGESGGPLSTIGYLEAGDFDAAFRHLKDRKPGWSRLGLVGLSMGAAMAIRAMAQYPGFRCAVLESPFQSFNGVVARWTWNAYRLPYFPAAWMTLLVIRMRLGGDPEPYSPAHNIRGFRDIPLLFIAGGEDRLMPLEEVQGLYEAAQGPKSIWVVPGASHGKCQETIGAEYDRRILEFLEKNL